MLRHRLAVPIVISLLACAQAAVASEVQTNSSSNEQNRIVLSYTGAQGSSPSSKIIFGPKEPVNLKFNKAKLVSAIAEKFPSVASPELQQAVNRIVSLKQGVTGLRIGIMELQNSKTISDSNLVWKKLFDSVLVIDGASEGTPLKQKLRDASRQISPNETEVAQKTVLLVIPVIDAYLEEQQRAILLAAERSSVKVSLNFVQERNPVFRPRLNVSAPIVLDPEALAALDGLADTVLGDGNDSEKLRAIALQTFGYSTVKPKWEAAASKGKAFSDAIGATEDNTLKALKELAVSIQDGAKKVTDLEVQGTEKPSEYFTRISLVLNGLRGSVSATLDELKTKFSTINNPASGVLTAYTEFVKSLNELEVAATQALNGASGFFGISQTFEEVSRWSRELEPSFSDQYDVLRRTGADSAVLEGDEITIELTASKNNENPVLLEEPLRIGIYRSGWYRRDEPITFYAFPLSSDKEKKGFKDSAGLGYAFMFSKGSSTSLSKNRTPDWGLGLHLGLANFDQDGSYETAVGATVGLLDNLIMLGYGYNLSKSTPYAFAGLRLRIK